MLITVPEDKKREHGFTLLELMFVVAIIGIIAIFAAPNYYSVKENYRLENGAQKAASQLEYGRQTAMDKRETVYIIFDRNQVGVYRNANGILELSGPTQPYEGGVTFTIANNSWLSDNEIHQDLDDTNSLLLGHGITYDFRGFPNENGTVRLQSQSGQTVCILIGEGTGRITIDQCEDNPEDITDIVDDDDDDDEEESYCNGDDGPLPDHPAWVAQAYPTAGTYVIHSGRVFYNRWYANASDVPGAGTANNPGPWQEVTKLWQPFNYYSSGARVCYNGKEFVMWEGYTNQHGNAPGIVNNPWQEQTNEWRAYNRYNGGDIVIFEGKQYQMWAGYTNQLNKQPGIVNNPWQELTDQWRNFNRYNTGDIVWYNGSQFQQRDGQNIVNKQPGLMDSPWQELTDLWRSFNVYNTGDEVTHNGHRYRAKWYSKNAEPGISSAWQLIS